MKNPYVFSCISRISFLTWVLQAPPLFHLINRFFSLIFIILYSSICLALFSKLDFDFFGVLRTLLSLGRKWALLKVLPVKATKYRDMSRRYDVVVMETWKPHMAMLTME
jgi:hypothetical protein